MRIKLELAGSHLQASTFLGLPARIIQDSSLFALCRAQIDTSGVGSKGADIVINKFEKEPNHDAIFLAYQILGR